MEFLRKLFTSDFMGHGYCYLWRPEIVWLHVISDSLITLAYYSIPITLLYFARRRRDLSFSWIYIMFAAFILACGTTHLMEVWTIWHGTYRLAGAIKFLTAGLSVGTAIVLVPLIPKALALPSPARLAATNQKLEREIRVRLAAEEEVRRANETLESRVAERTAELQAAHRETEESQRLLRALADNSLAVIYVKDVEGRYLLVNRRFEQLFRVRREDAAGKTDFDIFADEDAEAYRATDRQALDRGVAIEVEETATLDDGLHTYISVKYPLRDAGGEAYAVGGISTDITDRKLEENKLQAQLGRLDLLGRVTAAIGERQDLRSIFQVVIRSLEDSLPIDFGCICLYDQTARRLIVTTVGSRSSALAADLGMPEQAVVGVDESGLSRCLRGELVYEPEIRGIDMPFPRRLAAGGLRSLVIAPLSVERKVFGILISARRAPNAFSAGDCDFLRQLSGHVALAAHHAQVHQSLQQAYEDLQSTQAAMVQQERLRALGQIASGIAHDINNAISPIGMYADLLLEREESLSEAGRQQLTTIGRAIDDVAQTVSRMREVYRPSMPNATLAPVQINLLIEHVLELTRGRWQDIPEERGIVLQIVRELDGGLPEVAGVEGEIRDALTNVILNAIDAMPDGGTLRLTTRTVSLAAGRQVMVEIADTGVGMDEKTTKRCLEPFFTTKGERGTGLGLAMVYGMVQRHNAEIDIRSILGLGTVVRLSFPVLATSSAAPTVVPTVPASKRSLRILVIDDDPTVLGLMKDALEGDGHFVATAGGGLAGIEVFMDAQAKSDPFTIVITDLGMPHVDGRKVAASIKGASPRTPIILITGWGQRLADEGDIPANVDRLLNKPPKLQQLREALEELTGGSQASLF